MNIPAVLASAFLILGPGCTSERLPDTSHEGTGMGPTPPPSTVTRRYTPDEMRLAKNQLRLYCVNCHGRRGKGDGPVGANLDPKPRDWSSAAWQESVDDAHLFKVIRDGGPAVGLSRAMTRNPQYRGRPGVIHALVALVRRLDETRPVQKKTRQR